MQKIKKKIRCVLFDFDGVLIDSLPVMKIAWDFVKKKYGLTSDFNNFKENIGLPFYEILKNLNINKDLYPKITKDYALISSRNKTLIKLNSNVTWLINWLNKNSIKIGIVTSKDKIRTKELIEFFQIDIKLVVTPESTSRGKPFPDPIFFASKELSISPKNILFIGDMESDLKCANMAECYYLHYKNGYQQLVNQSYGGEINNLKEIAEFIEYF